MTIGMLPGAILSGTLAPKSGAATVVSPVLIWTTAVVWTIVALVLLVVAAAGGRWCERGGGTVPRRPGSGVCCLGSLPCCMVSGGDRRGGR